MFGCTPDVAERQDWTLVQQIIDYRNARTAIDLFNRGREGAEQLAEHPSLMELLREMWRAQSGKPIGQEEMLSKLRRAEESIGAE